MRVICLFVKSELSGIDYLLEVRKDDEANRKYVEQYISSHPEHTYTLTDVEVSDVCQLKDTV